MKNAMKHSFVIFVFLSMGVQCSQVEATPETDRQVTAHFIYRIINDSGFYDQCIYESVFGRHSLTVQKTELCPIITTFSI